MIVRSKSEKYPIQLKKLTEILFVVFLLAPFGILTETSNIDFLSCTNFSLKDLKIV